nr:MAG TPA: hypothetical protein [Bacteriophage sp.]
MTGSNSFHIRVKTSHTSILIIQQGLLQRLLIRE